MQDFLKAGYPPGPVIGAGKYDQELSKALELAQASQGVLIVLDGPNGAGFSAHLLGGTVQALPGMLRQVAQQIEADWEDRN